jgi:integrase/recombinase XerD
VRAQHNNAASLTISTGDYVDSMNSGCQDRSMASRRSVTVDETVQPRLVEAWVERQRSANTRAAYRTELKTFGAWCAGRGTTVLDSDLQTMIAFATAREAAGDRPSTLRRRWSALSSFFDFAIEQHAVSGTNPLDGMSRPTTATGNPSTTGRLSTQTVADYRLIAAELDPRLDALVSLLIADGFKLAEALALDVHDVSGRPPTTHVRTRRRGDTTRILLDPASAAAVTRCVGARREGPLFLSAAVSPTGPRRLTRFGADHLIRQLARDGARRVTANELRRFHITSSHRTGDDLDTVRDRAGLASVRSVRRYLPESDR